MAYENYSFVSWTDGTPITSGRLGQMSTNIEQVKDSEERKPQGLLKLNTASSSIANVSDFDAHLLVSLKDETSTGGSDNSISSDADRTLKFTVNFPGFAVRGKGSEDSTYNLYIRQGEFGDGGSTVLATWKMTPATYSYIDVSSNANADITAETVKSTAYHTRFGAGTYSILLPLTASITAGSYYVSYDRVQGASAANAPAYYLDTASTAAQFYVEDVGSAV